MGTRGSNLALNEACTYIHSEKFIQEKLPLFRGESKRDPILFSHEVFPDNN